jgi:hypothetical protein
MFRSQLFDHLQGAVFPAYCCYYFSAFLRRLFGMWLYVVDVCACLDALVCGMFGCELFTSKHTTDKYIRHARTHIDNIQPHTK